MTVNKVNSIVVYEIKIKLYRMWGPELVNRFVPYWCAARGRCFVRCNIVTDGRSPLLRSDMIICFIMGGYAHFVKDNCCDNWATREGVERIGSALCFSHVHADHTMDRTISRALSLFWQMVQTLKESFTGVPWISLRLSQSNNTLHQGWPTSRFWSIVDRLQCLGWNCVYHGLWCDYRRQNFLVIV